MNKIKNFYNNLNQKYINNFDKYKILNILPKNIFLLFILIILMIIALFNLKNNYVIYNTPKNPDGIFENINKDGITGNIKTTNLKQIDYFGIYTATYKRKNNCIYKLYIYENKKILKQIKFNPKEYLDNKVHYFKVDIKNINKKNKYSFKIVPIKTDKNNQVAFLKDNGKLAYSIVLSSDFQTINYIILFITLISFFIINYNINIKKLDESKILLLMIPFMLFLLVLIPPNEVPDEGYHFSRAYKTSQYNFKYNLKDNFSKKLSVPSNFECLNYSYSNNENALYKGQISNCIKNTNNKKVNLIGGYTRIISTIPGAIGIKIADIFTNSPLIIFYSGRLFAFIVNLFILYSCLKIAPKHKNILLFIMLLPIFIQQNVSYSYDGLLNSLCLLVTAYLIKFYNDDGVISKKDFIIYILASLIIFIIKMPYILIPLLIIFLPKEKFGKSKSSKYIKILLFILFVLLIYILNKYIISLYSTKSVVTDPNKKVNTISYLLTNPKALFLTIIYTLHYNLFNYLREIIGVLGWLVYPLNNLFIIIYYIIFILLILSNKSNLDKNKRIFNLITMLILIGGIFMALYVDWTPYHTYVINGVQGRYFLPLLPIIFINLFPKKEKLKIDKNFFYSFSNISMLFLIASVLVFYY